MPAKRNLEVESAAGYSWRETDDEIEVRIPLPPDASAHEVDVEITATRLHVAVRGAAVLSGALCGALLASESSWSLEHTDDDESAAGGAATDGAAAGGVLLQLDLMKKVASASDEPLWGYLLADERDENRGYEAD